MAAHHHCSSWLLITIVHHGCSSPLFIMADHHHCSSWLLITIVHHGCSSPLFIMAAHHHCSSWLLITIVHHGCSSPLLLLLWHEGSPCLVHPLCCCLLLIWGAAGARGPGWTPDPAKIQIRRVLGNNSTARPCTLGVLVPGQDGTSEHCTFALQPGGTPTYGATSAGRDRLLQQVVR